MEGKYLINEKVLSEIKDSIINTDNKLVKLSGIKISELKERYIKLEMPLGDVNINHIGTAYAISIVMLMEVAGASLIRATYGTSEYIPIIKRIDIQYIKPTSDTLVCELKMTEEDAEKSIRPIEERGRGNFLLPVLVTDINGNEVAKAEFTFYLIPPDYKI
ncbi:MAG: DUF4442 domain-containing protein [Bacteroidales bacterium]|jgi:acyl-coenzyme A thioesterase PaaI-like protein|nr:DUF4442 domain-containing protein [Bacteroidales bacterium]